MTSRILFGVIAALVLIGISYFTAKTYAVGFRFTGVQTKLGLFTFLLIPIAFVGSIIMVRSATLGSAALYTAIQLIAGAGLYIFISAIILGIALGIGALLHITVPIWVAYGTLCIAILLIAGGLIQSRLYTVRDYTVTLENLPASWDGKTAILVADTHFGLVNHASFSNKVVDRILAQKPDFVLHAGDFYDGPAVDTAPITSSWARLASAVPVFYAPGNHEMYGDYGAFVDSIRASGVTVLDDKQTLFDGVQIAGITYRSGRDDPAAETAIGNLGINPSVPAILINHPPTSLAAAAAAHIDLQVSGHTHNGQFWPMNYIVKRIYGHYVHGLATFGDMQVLTTSGIGTFGPPYRLFNTPELVRITFKTTSAQ